VEAIGIVVVVALGLAFLGMALYGLSTRLSEEKRPPPPPPPVPLVHPEKEWHYTIEKEGEWWMLREFHYGKPHRRTRHVLRTGAEDELARLESGGRAQDARAESWRVLRVLLLIALWVAIMYALMTAGVCSPEGPPELPPSWR